MNNKQLIPTNKQTMSSIEIAQVAGKQHKNVMQAIRSMEPAWKVVSGLNFQLASYKDAQGKERPCYELTKTECLYIATKFNDEARARLVLRWEELEKQQLPAQAGQLPGAYSLLTKALEERERAVIAEQALKDVGDEFTSMVCASSKHQRNWHTMRVLQKLESACEQLGIKVLPPDYPY